MRETYGVAHNEEGQRGGGPIPTRTSLHLANVIATLPFEFDSRNHLDLQCWTDDLVRSIEQWRHLQQRRREGFRASSMFCRKGGGQ